MSLTHLGLVDDCGQLYMQGCNRYGQLGTGDKIDRGEPTKVSESNVCVQTEECVCVFVCVCVQTKEEGER